MGGTDAFATARVTHASSARNALACRLTNAGCFIPPCAASDFRSSGLFSGSSFFS